MGDADSPVPKRHAGYRYSGPCAAWAYKCLDLSKAKRVFVLGPSHTYYLQGCALTRYAKYATPFGDLTVDAALVQELRDTGRFSDMKISRRYGESVDHDVEEHSLEMHLPYIYKRIAATFPSEADHPTIVPILVGDNSGPDEKDFGRLLAPYLRDPDNAWVVSSDFCHWGSHFSYRPCGDKGAPIHEHIHDIDHQAMDAIESGKHNALVDNLARTNNTVCGRHPIGVTMAALEVLAEEKPEEGKNRFKFVQYQRSSMVESMSDSSVSYASAYAIV